jgi:predicted MFS family arabinose efflux permease
VLAAFTAMCVVRGSVGFVTFFLAFNLKRAGAATWWYGFIVLASGIGGLAGSSVVPLVRRRLSEERIIFASLVLSTLFALGTALIGGLWAQPLLTFVVGLAGTTAKPSFDSLVQREVPALMQGRAFARFETWLQLVWVAAALVAVLVDFRLRDGDIVVAVACGIAAVFYASMRQSARYHDAQLAQPAAP